MALEQRPVTPVGILAEVLGRAHARLGELVDPDPQLVAYLERAEALAAGLEPYLDLCTSPQSPGLRALAERTRTVDWEGREGGTVALEGEMLSGHLEGRYLAMLIRATGARRVLEIGTFTGYSALAMAEALPADGSLVACELDPEPAAIAAEAFAASPAASRIDLRVGAATDTLADLAAAEDAFDFVFIDADKAGYREYVDILLSDRLLADGGLICVDNTLLMGEPYLPWARSYNGDAIVAFNGWLAADPRTEQVLVPMRDGITMIRRVDSPPPTTHPGRDR